MKNIPLLPRQVLLAGAVFLSATAIRSPAQSLSDPTERSGWFLRAGAAARFNVKASVKALPSVPGGQGVYDDGTVAPDVGGTASGVTWNWSYESDSQVAYDLEGEPESIVFHRLDNVPSIGSQDMSLDSPILEGELIGGFHFDDFSMGKRKARFGFEIGYGYFSLSQGMSFQEDGIVTQTIRPYRLWGVVPPVAPYAGTFDGPGPLLDLYPDAANSTTNMFLSTTTLEGSLNATFHNFRFGPSFGVDLSRRLGVQIGVGYDSLYSDATFSYLETSAYTPVPRTVSLTETKWQAGFYAEILVNFQLTKRLGIYLGGDFRFNKDLTFGNATHEVTLELGSTYAGKGGLSYSF